MTQSSRDLADILDELRRFVHERDWEQFHDAKNLVMALASEVGELVAEYRWASSAASDSLTEEPDRRLSIEKEVADVAITLLLLCDRVGIDLLPAIRGKLELNAANYPLAGARGTPSRPPSPSEAER
jgi:NTP pyrophosphatase (non-canonical NTP hydrolase)